jgi:hypothetical protein
VVQSHYRVHVRKLHLSARTTPPSRCAPGDRVCGKLGKLPYYDTLRSYGHYPSLFTSSKDAATLILSANWPTSALKQAPQDLTPTP